MILLHTSDHSTDLSFATAVACSLLNLLFIVYRTLEQQHVASEEAAKRKFEAQVDKLHYLASTASTPGVFNSPYMAATGRLPIVEGLTLEEHLKRSMKAQV